MVQLKILYFFMTGRRNRAHAPKQTLACKVFRRRNAGMMPCKPNISSTRAPADISAWLFIWIKKLDSKSFYLQRAAIKFSANIISATVYLFVGNPCLWGRRGAASTLRRRAAPYKVARKSW